MFQLTHAHTHTHQNTNVSFLISGNVKRRPMTHLITFYYLLARNTKKKKTCVDGYIKFIIYLQIPRTRSSTSS